MNYFPRYVIALTLAILPIKIGVSSAHEVAANFPAAAIANINGHGRRDCRALGKSGFIAKVKGLVEDGGGGVFYGDYRPFTVRTCFKSKQQCNQFIKRIHHRIGSIERIHYARCKSRA